jgi:hypothetical protein
LSSSKLLQASIIVPYDVLCMCLMPCLLQDCLSLLLVYQRPMPRTMRNLGSWNTVLLVQVGTLRLQAVCLSMLHVLFFFSAISDSTAQVTGGCHGIHVQASMRTTNCTRQLTKVTMLALDLALQVFMAVVTNVFLSGQSSGQLAQLLPSCLVPEAVRHSITAAAASRPSDSSTAGQLGAYTATGWPPSPLNTLEAFDAGREYMQGFVSIVGPFDWQPYNPGGVCPVPGLSDSITYSKMCPAGYRVLGSPVFHAAMAPNGARDGAVGFPGASGAASTHLLLLFALEHLLVLLVVLVLTLVPNDPAGREPGRVPTQLPRPPPPPAAAAKDTEADVLQQQYTAQWLAPEGMQMHMQSTQPQSPASKALGVHVVSATQQPHAVPVSSVPGLQIGMQIEMPVQLHGNPLFTASTARKSNLRCLWYLGACWI